MHACMDGWMDGCMHMYVHIHMYIYVYSFVCVFGSLCIYIYIAAQYSVRSYTSVQLQTLSPCSSSNCQVFYCSSLEEIAFHRKSADFLWMLVCGAGQSFKTFFCRIVCVSVLVLCICSYRDLEFGSYMCRTGR